MLDTVFASNNEFFAAVYQDGSGFDTSLARKLRAAAGSDEAGRYSDPRGGFLTPPSFTTALLTRAWDFSRVAKRCNKLPVPGAELVAPLIRETSRVDGSRLGGVTSYWLPETIAAPTSRFEAEQLRLRPKKLVVLIPATNELVAGAPTFEEFLMRTASEEIAVKADQGIINGVVGGMSGILNSAAVVTVNKDSGQTAGTITDTNVVNMTARLWPYSDGNAVWFCSKSAEAAIQVGCPGLIRWAEPTAAAGTPRFTLCGAPVIPIEQCQPLGTPGDLILADCSQYTIGERGEPSMVNSLHVRFVNDESMFKIIYDIDGRVTWLAPVVPMTDTASLTQSPFVVLAERS